MAFPLPFGSPGALSEGPPRDLLRPSGFDGRSAAAPPLAAAAAAAPLDVSPKAASDDTRLLVGAA